MTTHRGALRRPWRLVVVAVLVLGLLGAGGIASNAFGVGDRWERLVARVERFIDPPPLRASVPTVVVTQQPEPATTTAAVPSISPIPATPAPARLPVDFDLVDDHAAT